MAAGNGKRSEVRVRIPQFPESLNGPFIEAKLDHVEVLARREGAVIIEFHEMPEGVDWFEDFEHLYCREEHDPEIIKVIRRATADEIKEFRIPIWIQSEEEIECCGRPMHFVGQIDDDRICTERPKGAKYWWHDKASFYVFTCSQCLEWKAIGQQY